MNAEIKYENCDEIWERQPNWEEERRETGIQQSTSNLKRNYDAMEKNNEGAADYAYYQENMSNDYQNNPQYTNAFPTKLVKRGGGGAMKHPRKRKNEISIVFQPPFFQLQKDHALLEPRSIISARCLSCNVSLRGNKYVSSNFIKHMKRVHPNMYKIYENMKALKSNGFATADALAAGNSTAQSNLEQHSQGEDGNDKNEPSTDEQEYFGSMVHSYYTEGVTENTEENITVAGDEDEDEDDNENDNSEITDNSDTLPPQCNESSEIHESDTFPSNQAKPAGVRVVSSQNLRVITSKSSGAEEQSAKVDLSTETLQAMSNLLDQKLKHFVTKSEFNRTTRNSTDSGNVKTTSNVTTNQDKTSCMLQQQINVLQKECTELRAAVKRGQRSKCLLHRELIATDRIIRRGKLIIHNIKVEPNEVPLKAFEKLLREILCLPHVKVQKCIALTNNKTPNNKQKLLVELQNQNDAMQIFTNCKRLKNTGIFIEPQLSQYARKRSEKLLVLRKEILRRNSQLHVFVRSTQLIVQGKHFYWDDIDGLCVGDEKSLAETVDVNALECMQTLTGLDLKEFLNVLQNYDIRMST